MQRLRQHVLTGRLCAGQQRQALQRAEAVAGAGAGSSCCCWRCCAVRHECHLHQLRRASCEGACLVKQHSLHAGALFQGRAALDEHPCPRPHASAHHDSSGRGQAQGAGAGHHQHSNCKAQCKDKGRRGARAVGQHGAQGPALPQPPPHCQHSSCSGSHCWGKAPRDGVSVALDGGARHQAGLHQGKDLCQHGLPPQAHSPHGHEAWAIEGAPSEGVPRGLGHRPGLPSEHGLIDL